ncbi:MAG: class I SAM-dependent methyltransferase [Proteobacteria bacterium]|nr:class I SAM-dependent methyltransferase [Pseudomonadota bacterium]
MSSANKGHSSHVSNSADVETVAYYSNNAAIVAKKYEEALFEDIHHEEIQEFVFRDSTIQSIKLIDVGCGSGRDLSHWYKLNVDGYGVDASKNMIEAAVSAHPELKGRIFFDELPFLNNTPSGFYHVVTCFAVLMHLNFNSIKESIKAFKRILKPQGKLVISIPLRGPEIDADSRSCKDGRLFTLIPIEHLNGLLTDYGFDICKTYSTQDSLGRSERSWITLLCRLR